MDHPHESPALTTSAGRLDAPLLRDLATLTRAAEDSDGNPPLSDQTWVELRTTDDPDAVHTVTAWLDHGGGRDGELAGVAVRTGSTLELVVHPSCRSQGVGTALARAALDAAPDGELYAWAHGSHAGAARLADQFGLTPVRELLRLRLTHREEPLAEVPLPEGIRIRPFTPGDDDGPWLALNAAAFAAHPEQGQLDQTDLDSRKAEDWFDPAGFLLAEETGTGELLGYHWTKIHAGQGGHPDLGEVYAVGVGPAAQGRGLGRALTVAGIRHLQQQGVESVMLYVDADNVPAVALYRDLGFVCWDTDVQYARVPLN